MKWSRQHLSVPNCGIVGWISFFLAAISFFGLLNVPVSEGSTNNQDLPTIAKDSVQVTAFTFNVYRKSYDTWSWVPRIQYRANGPIPSGSQLYVEFTLPGSQPWLKFDCKTGATQKGR